MQRPNLAKDVIRINGHEWLSDKISAIVEHVEKIIPSKYTEDHRYLTSAVTPLEGPMRWDINPFMREIVDCFSLDSPVREVSVMKGVQITYTTTLESCLFYDLTYIRSLPLMYITADKELAEERVENNILPMLDWSGFKEVIQSSDIGNKRKSGQTKRHIQVKGGGVLYPFGANNAKKMRQFSIARMYKDEIDGWPDVVGKDGDPDALTDDRCSAYWHVRKIFRGSTPLLKETSKIYRQYLRGDQRKYFVCCLKCGFAQFLRWRGKSKDTGIEFGLKWDIDDDGQLDHDSVRYVCANCGHGHEEYDKEKLFSPDHGAKWEPTEKPREPNIRSYHLPALYSPVGMQPWYKSVALYLEAWNPDTKQVVDQGKFQVFYNNILAEPFEVRGSKITMNTVSSHRRIEYKYGEIPNHFAAQYAGSKILFLTCQVDVHKHNLDVAIMGWTKHARCFLIDYLSLEDFSENGCESPDSPVWEMLEDIVDNRNYTSGDGYEYGLTLTLVDAGYITDTVVTFCAKYEGGVYPSIGRDRPDQYHTIKEFAEYKTQSGLKGYKIVVDHYKDRLAPVLRREWSTNQGLQEAYHFNAPYDTTDKQLRELTREQKKEIIDDRGRVKYRWHRPNNARNELWDLLVYGNAAVEILAWQICIKHLEAEQVDWDWFWNFWEARM